jgi:hypothetical protein
MDGIIARIAGYKIKNEDVIPSAVVLKGLFCQTLRQNRETENRELHNT